MRLLNSHFTPPVKSFPSAAFLFLFFSFFLTSCNQGPLANLTDKVRNITGANSGTTDSSSSSAVNNSVQLDSEEAAFLQIINTYRADNGLAPLTLSNSLTRASKWMATDMANNNYLAHVDSGGRDPVTRILTFGYPINNTNWGENCAAGHADAQGTFLQWKNSPGHNANMLGANFKVIGIGRAQGSASHYGFYWTTDFGGLIDSP